MEALYDEFVSFLKQHSTKQKTLAEYANLSVSELVDKINRHLRSFSTFKSVLKSIIAEQLGISCFDKKGLDKLEYFINEFLKHAKE